MIILEWQLAGNHWRWSAFNIKKKPAMNNMFINTLSSSLSCLLPHRCIHTHIVFILCYVIGHFASIIANIIIYAYFTQFELGIFFFFPMLHN